MKNLTIEIGTNQNEDALEIIATMDNGEIETTTLPLKYYDEHNIKNIEDELNWHIDNAIGSVLGYLSSKYSKE